jgi:hypothetical protein
MSSNQSIAKLAYHLWNARGRPHGSEEEDWLEAERQLAAEAEANVGDAGRESTIDASLKETFPASDPAASHIPDLPPSNAEAKWSAADKRPRKSVNGASASAGSNPPVDETDDAPTTAPRDIGEG